MIFDFKYLNIYLQEMQQQHEQFEVALEKLMTSEVATTLWAANMDLLALTTFDNLVQLYRISYKAQKVFQSDEGKPIRSISFSPDSQLLAYAMNDGIIKIVKTQNGQRLIIVDNVHTQQIQTLSFTNFYSLKSTSFLPFQKNSLESKLILNICPHKNCNKNAIIKINYFSEISNNFTLMLSSQKNRTLFLLNGFIPFAQINIQKIGINNPKILYSHYDEKVYTVVSEQSGSKNIIWVLEHQAKVLNDNSEHLIKYNCLLGYISQIFSFVEVAYDSAELIVRDILRQYNSKINLIDDPNIQNLNPCEQLFKFLNCGITSTAIVNFFSKEVYDTKILQKLDENLNTFFAQLHDLILQSIQNSLQKATFLLKKLQNFSKVKNIENLGLSYRLLQKIEQKIVKLYTMGDILLVESTQAKFDIRNLLVWLNKSTIKSSGQNQAQIQNTKSYLHKYTVDFNRLHKFLSDQRKFKMQNLLSFFSKTQESHLMMIQEPEFHILSSNVPKKRPQEQILLFNRLAVQFGVDGISTSGQKMQIQETYRSFKVQVKDVISDWKAISNIPFTRISTLLNQKYIKSRIGQISSTQTFPSEIKCIIKDNELFVYFIQRQQNYDKLIEYNCHKKQSKSLISSQNHILSVAVAKNIKVVLQNKENGQSLIGQVVNEELDGSEIVIGRSISKLNGQLDINSSFKDLNSLVTNKNKLIIFFG